MSKQVIWTKETTQFFLEHANLTELEQKVLRTRVANKTRTEQCEMLHISTATLDRKIKRIKLIYDEVQRQNPDKLPERKESAEELYMDTH